MPRGRQYGNYRQLSEFHRHRIVGFLYKDIGNRFNRNRCIIGCYYQAWNRERHERQRRGTVRRKKTNVVQDRHLRLMATGNQLSSSRSIIDQSLANESRSLTLPTVYRRNRAFGLH